MDISDMFNHLHLLELDERCHCTAGFRDALASEMQERGSASLPAGTVIGALLAALEGIEKRVAAVEDELSKRQ